MQTRPFFKSVLVALGFASSMAAIQEVKTNNPSKKSIPFRHRPTFHYRPSNRNMRISKPFGKPGRRSSNKLAQGLCGNY